MLGNGYKERLANAQSNVSSLLMNASKQSTTNVQQQLFSEDNEPNIDSIFKHSFSTKLVNPTAATSLGNLNNAITLPPVPVPALESNSSSRHSLPKNQGQQQQQQQRTSRLPNASLSLGRLLDQFPELGSPLSESNSVGAPNLNRSCAEDFAISTGFHQGSSFAPGSSSCSSLSRWDMPHQTFYEGNNNSCNRLMSDSPGIEEMAFMTIGRSGNATTTSVEAGMVNLVHIPGFLEAVMTIQRAVRRFLVRKHSKINKSSALPIPKANLRINTNVTAPNNNNNDNEIDIETLQQTCLRQSEEIDQLKELMTKLLLEAEEDRRKLRQRDREIEELLKQQQQQKLSQSASTASGFDVALPSTTATSSIFNANNNNSTTTLGLTGATLASSSTAASFNSFGLSSLSRDDSSAGLEHHLSSNALGVSADDFYESNLSYSSSIGGPPLHPLSLPSRSNSISSLQSQQPQQSSVHQGLSLKINASQSFYNQQYQGLMDMVDSPSTSDFGSDISTPSAFGAAAATTTGRGLSGAHGFSSQSSFPLLSHRNSGSFSSTSRTFDSPALEQQTPYPWNAPGSLSHSQSWADEMAYGYDSNVPSPGQFGGLSHSAGYDPNFINQQYPQQSQQGQQQQHQGLPPHRNSYRRHSEKPAHLDYQMCVDRILQATDQQASIHLQQKLKTSPPEQKIQIIDAILGQAYALMSNRFGNFLIQRCFEFGSPQQIEALAQAMRGNILTLACDPFGCHVVQKALDNVEEDCKARIVTEMFRRIRETIVHRYACHVWQKVFEIRWTDAPPAVMTYVNNAVAGKWASVAVDETGSLVVQNIFENCAEHDKRPVLNEILQSVTTISKGQWGNWVIQHILEHGALADRATVTQKILEDAVTLSLDQYASKVVEKTLRMAAAQTSTTSTLAENNKNAAAASDDNNGASSGSLTLTVNGTTIRLCQEDVMNQYIHIVCDGVQDRPRIPLIDIAADQYGNYIVQYILTNAGPQHRETCATLIKRHMVSLRGSKYGQKVAFMVERWRGNPFSGNGNNNGGNGGQGSGSGSNYGSKSGSGSGSGSGSDGNSGNSGGGGRRRW
ncbi:hypothetical protein BGZ46_002723 [Entomortierella lignicola]|nr:hypothetical protein BGZ46_002723 [Entomortierella lignicola]